MAIIKILFATVALENPVYWPMYGQSVSEQKLKTNDNDMINKKYN